MTTPLQPLSAPTLATPSASAGTYTDLNGLAALKNAPTSPEAIRAVSQQVEALFLQMMLKSMRDATAEDGETDSNETSMYQDMFDKQIALSLSQHGGLGLGTLLTRQLSSGAAPASTPA
ncbi:MAG: rod-binding protein, partial [Steroidobacteraceae bacterium]